MKKNKNVLNSLKSIASYSTDFGYMLEGKAEKRLEDLLEKDYENKIQLFFTSPPFPLKRKKKYGNEIGEEYLKWLASYAPLFNRLLRDDGSIVLEIGNAWEPGEPVMSTLAVKALLYFMEKGGLYLCQQFVAYNPARLPGPAQWVNVERIRVKDSFTHIWWFSKTTRPYANNREVLKEYSSSMKQLLKTKKYNAGIRPSEHYIGEKSFLTNNAGAIPSNVLTVANTRATDDYIAYCKKHEYNLHPARMPIELPEFFIKFLTKKGDVVIDPFAGSNTTGAAAEKLGRKWVAIECNSDYIKGSKGRFNK